MLGFLVFGKAVDIDISRSYGLARTRNIPLLLVLFLIIVFTIAIFGPASGTLLAIGIFCCLLFLENIKVALLTLLILRTTMDQFSTVEILPSANPQRVFGVFFLIIGVLYILSARVNVLATPVSRAYFIFLCIAGLAVPWSSSLTEGLNQWSRFASGLLILVLVSHVFRTKQDIDAFTKAYLCSLFVPLSIMLYQHLTGGGVTTYSDIDVRSVIGGYRGTNSAASFLTMVLPMVLFRLTIARRRYRILYFALLIAVSLSILYTYLRTAWLGMITQLLTWNLLRKAWASLFILVLMLAIAVLVPSKFRDRMDSDLHLGSRPIDEVLSDPEAASGRFAFQKANLLYFLSSPVYRKLIGSGFGRTQDAGQQILGYSVVAHNDYLYLLVCNGVIGLLAYLWLLITLFRQTIGLLRISSHPYFRCMGYAFLVLLLSLLQMMISNHLIMSVGVGTYFWAFAGVVLSAKRIQVVNSTSQLRDDSYFAEEARATT